MNTTESPNSELRTPNSNGISLCMMVGNVEEYIERCLKSFLRIADEVCMVRAIGNQKADATIEKAKALCESAGIPFKFAEYKNARAHADWPHTDSFAAARQMSFDLASNEYCFWCDSDDVLESGAEVVRELAERGGYAAFIFPYKIFGKGMNVPRERMMLKRGGKWLYAVHECFDFHIKPVQGIEDQRVVVTHLPHLSKTGSNDRNLRILKSIPRKELTTGLLYHLHLELALHGDIPGSVAAAKQVLERPDLGKPERYELFLNLAQAAKDPNQKHALLHQAYAADPCRREALGLLCNVALNYWKAEDGLAYARQMMATPPPRIADWNDRQAIYGWVGDDLFAQAMRANGFRDAAEKLRKERLEKSGGPRIALVHATRGRPEQASTARKIWLDMASQPDRVEHIFVFDHDDTESHMLRRFHHLELTAGGGCVAAWNHGCMATTAPIVVQLSDDWTPLPQWDDLILERMGDLNKPSVLAISDGFRTDELLCMVICTRAYLALDEFMFHPWFTGVYSDNWFTQMAYARNAVIQARDVVFTHEHYMKNGKEPDATYQQQNAPARYLEGQHVLKLLQQQNDWSSVPGFFNYWSFYKYVASKVKDGDTLAEVGCWLGRSLIYLAQELKRQGKANCKLLAVDHFKGESNQKEHEATLKFYNGSLRAEFEKNIQRCGVADMITIIDSDSAAGATHVLDASLAFCFIDAAHDYESVKRDIAAWTPKVAAEGILSGHDANWHEVRRAVDEGVAMPQYLGDVWVMALPKELGDGR